MHSEKGNTLILILIISLIVLLIGGLVIFKRGDFAFLKQTNPPLVSITENNSIDLSNPPAEKFLPDFISHCNNTPNYYWSGSECSPKQ